MLADEHYPSAIVFICLISLCVGVPHSPTKLDRGAYISLCHVQKVSVVLDHAQESTELFNILWWC